jgi:cytochrome c oxidase subunit 4
MEKKIEKEGAKEVHPAYNLVFLALAVFTALEVGASYLPHGVKIPILVILAATKVTLVLLFFMHLKYDRPIFSAPLIIGAILAIPIVLIIVLVMPMIT